MSQFELKQSDIPINMSYAIRIHLCVNSLTLHQQLTHMCVFSINLRLKHLA